jgi:UDP-glucuronate 4-epimerase
MDKKKILITGAAGFIGYHLIKLLSESNFVLVGLDNLNDYYDVNLKLERLKQSGIILPEMFNEEIIIKSTVFANYTFIKGDISELELLELIVEKYSITQIIHLAAQAGVRYSIKNPRKYFESNIDGFFNILEITRKYRMEELVFASSSSVYGESDQVPFKENEISYKPESFYAATKMCNEIMASSYSKIYNIKIIGLRFFTVYGPFGRPDMAPFLFASSLQQKTPISIFNNGLMERDFTYVEDIVKYIHGILGKKMESNFSIFNIGNGSPIKLLKFIQLLEEEFGAKSEKIYFPMQQGDVTKTWASTDEIEKVVAPIYKTKIEDGIKEFVNWFKEYYKLNK